MCADVDGSLGVPSTDGLDASRGGEEAGEYLHRCHDAHRSFAIVEGAPVPLEVLDLGERRPFQKEPDESAAESLVGGEDEEEQRARTAVEHGRIGVGAQAEPDIRAWERAFDVLLDDDGCRAVWRYVLTLGEEPSVVGRHHRHQPEAGCRSLSHELDESSCNAARIGSRGTVGSSLRAHEWHAIREDECQVLLRRLFDRPVEGRVPPRFQ